MNDGGGGGLQDVYAGPRSAIKYERMNLIIKMFWRSANLVILGILAACAGDDIAPEDIEKQAFDDLRAELREAIDDPERESEAIRLINAVQDDLAVLRATVEKRRQTVRQLNADYDTTRAEFEAYLASVEAEVREGP